MDTKRFNDEHAAKSRAVCERIEREDAERRSKLADLVDAQLKGELGRAKAEADGWRKIADRRLGHIGECESALAKRNERISKLEKQVSDLRAELEDTNRMLRESDQLGEAERRILDMWPRFEDGEYVWFGDEVDGLRGGIDNIDLYERTTNLYDGDVNLIMSFGERLKRPAPKVLDADGVEIKVGDTVWFMGNPRPYAVVGVKDGRVRLHSKTHCSEESATTVFTDILTHIAPDSWERLEEDALKGVCEYAEAERKPGTIDAHTCCGCRFDEDGDGPTCEKQMALDLIRRAKALAGAEVSE